MAGRGVRQPSLPLLAKYTEAKVDVTQEIEQNGLHQLGQPVALSVLFPVFKCEGEPGTILSFQPLITAVVVSHG